MRLAQDNDVVHTVAPDRSDQLQLGATKPSVGLFDDLIPKYKPCWDYRTDDGKNIDITKLSDEALVRVY
jgi:hypothetical protein